MTLLQVSVTGMDEALLALAHGADAIHAAADDAAEVAAIAAAVAGRVPVAASLPVPGVTTIEVPPDAVLPESWKGSDLIAVVGLDVFDRDLVPALAGRGFSGVMLDAGQGTRLFERTDMGALTWIADALRDAGLAFGIRGALETPDIPRFLLLGPDVLCLDRKPLRSATIDSIRVLIPSGGERAADAELEARRRVARALEPRRDEPTDRVFVRDFVLPMSIGAYAREHGLEQRVRFGVDVRVLRQSHAPADMRDVFSYDIITDTIRMIAAREHVALVEGLAETIAARLLTYPRVANVTVQVEKLDTGPGGVGVEITRERPAEAATVLPLRSEAQ